MNGDEKVTVASLISDIMNECRETREFLEKHQRKGGYD